MQRDRTALYAEQYKEKVLRTLWRGSLTGVDMEIKRGIGEVSKPKKCKFCNSLIKFVRCSDGHVAINANNGKHHNCRTS